jgi:xanthine dehydrogenase small subunit
MRDALRFVLNGQVQEIKECSATETALDFLRNKKRLTGTKEGCAEGDCGACTVVVAEVVDGQLTYTAVNSCILFLPTLDGKQLITVEHLQQPDGVLHPVQQALVDQHGSQCGFCTPGFVMSMFAMFHDRKHDNSSRDSINAKLAGNLCRCTGYAPIIRATVQSLTHSDTDQFDAGEAATIEQLGKLKSNDMLQMNGEESQFFAPVSVAELCSILEAQPDATIVAGATDVGLWVTKKLEELETVVYIGKVADLLTIERDELSSMLSIGAAVTYTQALEQILALYPDFKELLIRLGAVQVRNVGTIGGNIANGSPIGDMPPALIALGAQLVLRSTQGERTIDLEQFFIDYGKQDLQKGEFVSRVLIPYPSVDQNFRSYKISKRIEQDISAVCGAFSLELQNGTVNAARVCYGGMAATPKRATHCESALIGNAWCEQTIAQAMQSLEKDFSPISDMRASASYRMAVAQNLLRRFYLETSGKDYPVRLTSLEMSTQTVP